MANRAHRPFKVIAFNANGIARQRHKLSKQLQGLRINVALFSETRLKPHDRFHIQNYHFYRIDRDQSRKGGTAAAVRKDVRHMNVDLPRLTLEEATGVCIPIGNQEILIAAFYKSPGSTWNDADITELLSFRHKCILPGDLNAKHTSWNSAVSISSGQKLLHLFDTSDFEFSAPQCPTHYSPVGNWDLLAIAVHKNIRLSDVTVSEVLESDHLPIMFHILDHVRTKQISKPL
jgi:exonuclease III